MITLGFHGAAQTVTGSKYLLTAGAERLLVDCGQFQGRKDLRLRNWDKSPFDPKGVAWTIVTHAHIDHCGLLPRLVKEGFSGKILVTPATADLLPIMLTDAAKLQEEDAAYANRMGFSKHKPALPLFTQDDVARTLPLLEPVEYGAVKKLGGFSLRFVDVGHILGSAMAEVTAADAGRTAKVLFSGDVGRYNMPLPPDPEPPPACDYLVIESTYGDRKHGAVDPLSEIEALINRILANQAVLLIPAFAVGRSQQLLYMLRELETAKRIPRLPVHVDSPMAFDTTNVYLKYMEGHKAKMDALSGGAALVGGNVSVHKSSEESRRLADLKGPAVVIASSGMLAGGRILQHVKNFMTRPESILALVGYQAEGTRGRDLLEGKRTIKIFGQEVELRGEIANLGGFSGHADADELMRWTSSLPKPKRVFVTHGEAKAAAALAGRLKAERGWEAHAPALGEEVPL